MSPLFWLLACATAQSADPPATPAATEAPAERALVGQAPAEPMAAVTFADVVGHDGNPRTPEDLRSKPTVLWFYPMAGTPG